jgi:SAM-dependent methyltransferase
VDRRKAMVRDAYDAVASRWGEQRRTASVSAREHAWFERFEKGLPAAARILDLGCGAGAPMLARLLARGHRAIGVDFSRNLLAAARSWCPEAALVRADLTEVGFAPGAFDGAIAFDSLWHVPGQEHARIFRRLRTWLVDGGVALFTLAAAPDGSGELFTDLMGAPIYYDARPVAGSLSLLRRAGFTIIDHHLQPVSEARPASGHLIVLARAG